MLHTAGGCIMEMTSQCQNNVCFRKFSILLQTLLVGLQIPMLALFTKYKKTSSCDSFWSVHIEHSDPPTRSSDHDAVIGVVADAIV